MIQEVINMLKSDPEYYRAWKDNIAMAFKDEAFRCVTVTKEWDKQVVHEIANKAADRFLQQLINVPHGT